MPDAASEVPRPSTVTTRRGLARRLDQALLAGGDALDPLRDEEPADRRDALASLLLIHDLHTAPIERLGDRVRWQHHPALAALRWRLEERFIGELDAHAGAPCEVAASPDEAVAQLRAIAATDLVPSVYAWVADQATLEDLTDFLSLEGGPDGGFDDLVAACQIGLSGEPKLELARNYWDEMGNGSLEAVHTELHHRLAAALGLRAVPRSEQPVESLERSALGSLLATNRHLQPEMVGALGLLELQAGPRCRKVVQGLRRTGAPADAFPFYEEHAATDPRHGKDWLDNAIIPLSEDPDWAARMVRGARWRASVNSRFFAAMFERFVAAAGDAAPQQRAS
jgi:hypothetical protein